MSDLFRDVKEGGDIESLCEKYNMNNKDTGSVFVHYNKGKAFCRLDMATYGTTCPNYFIDGNTLFSECHHPEYKERAKTSFANYNLEKLLGK